MTESPPKLQPEEALFSLKPAISPPTYTNKLNSDLTFNICAAAAFLATLSIAKETWSRLPESIKAVRSAISDRWQYLQL